MTSAKLQNAESLRSMIATCLGSLFTVLSCKPLFLQKWESCNERVQVQDGYLVISPQSVSVFPAFFCLLLLCLNPYLIFLLVQFVISKQLTFSFVNSCKNLHVSLLPDLPLIG